mgnify:CR=1 FL=1
MAIYELDGHQPSIPDSAFVSEEVTLIGLVTLGERTSVWPGAVLRADIEPIAVGDESNIQEGAVLHVDPGFPLGIGRGVTVGHQAMLHGCTIEDRVLIGIQAVVMNGAVIGRESLVGAGAIVTEGKVFPPRSLILGAPAKLVRELTDADAERLADSANTYAEKGAFFATHLRRVR